MIQCGARTYVHTSAPDISSFPRHFATMLFPRNLQIRWAHLQAEVRAKDRCGGGNGRRDGPEGSTNHPAPVESAIVDGSMASSSFVCARCRYLGALSSAATARNVSSTDTLTSVERGGDGGGGGGSTSGSGSVGVPDGGSAGGELGRYCLCSVNHDIQREFSQVPCCRLCRFLAALLQPRYVRLNLLSFG